MGDGAGEDYDVGPGFIDTAVVFVEGHIVGAVEQGFFADDVTEFEFNFAGQGRRAKGSATASEQAIDLLQHLGGIPNLIGDEFFDYFAVAIDQVAFGILDCAVPEVDFLVGVAGGEVGERGALEEGFVELLVLIDADTEDDEAFGSQLCFEVVEAGDFFDAGRAPGGPEVEEQDFAAEVAGGDDFAGIGGDAEIGGGVAYADYDLVELVV